MGRSLTRVTPSAPLPPGIPASAVDPSLDRRFDIFLRQGKLYQSESQTAPGGEAVFRDTQQIQWIIGAGANGQSALVQRGNYLFEAPLSYFQSLGKWDISPGYAHQDIGFSRPVLAGCIACHSGRANPAEEDTGKFDAVPFSQAAIGCENCHGPGAEHVHAMSRGGPPSPNTHIVNPSRLTPELENDICMSCHEAGDSRVLRPGKKYQDFRPGTPLDNTLSILMIPLKRGEPRDTDHLQQSFEMAMSRCSRASDGRLRCATCHDPHVEPSAAEAPAYFNARCARCHSSRDCKLSLEARQKTAPADNCIGCHMPKREQTLTAHTSLTNHRILARPNEPWPDQAYEQSSPGVPDLVHFNRLAGHADDLPALSLLEAYRELQEQHSEYSADYARTLSELEQNDPDHAAIQEGLGQRDLAAGNLDEAIAHLRRAIALDPQRAMAYSRLSEALARQDHLDEAVAASEKAVSLNPYKALYRKALIDQLIAARQYPKAVAAMEQYMQLFPEDDFMRKMLELAKQP
jgi:hypothetical protein